MTVQASDIVFFRGQDYITVGVSGDGLFDPTEFDMQPCSASSACWRGLVCEYAVVDRMLFLDKLNISLSEGGPDDVVDAPTLNGRLRIRPEGTVFDSRYEDVQLPIPFSGGLLIVRDFIKELYANHPALAHHELRELLFEGGRLTSESDASEILALWREDTKVVQLEPWSDAWLENVHKWIDPCLSLKYRL